jgi:hypothetical protein
VSRTKDLPARAPAPVVLSSFDEAARDKLPTLNGLAEVVAYCASLGIQVSQRYVVRCRKNGTLRCTYVAHRARYSRYDVRAWLMAAPDKYPYRDV